MVVTFLSLSVEQSFHLYVHDAGFLRRLVTCLAECTCSWLSDYFLVVSFSVFGFRAMLASKMCLEIFSSHFLEDFEED